MACAMEKVLSPFVTATAISPNQVDLSWNPALGEITGYDITRSTLDYPNFFQSVGRVAANVYNYSDTSANPNTSYYYTVWPYGGIEENYLIEPQKTLVKTPAEIIPNQIIQEPTTPTPETTTTTQEPTTPTPEVATAIQKPTTESSKISILQIGNKKLYTNGSSITLDVAPKIEDGRTLVPLRAISEALGAQVTWSESTQTIIIRRQD
jgi:exo-beta-1,3-glucanase (GH17 family)